MFDEYMADRALIPDGNLVEIRYEDLERDLLGGVENMYKTFGWDGCVPQMSFHTRSIVYQPAV